MYTDAGMCRRLSYASTQGVEVASQIIAEGSIILLLHVDKDCC